PDSNLRLRSSALYVLGGLIEDDGFDQALIDAVLAEAAEKWVCDDRVWEIAQEIAEARCEAEAARRASEEEPDDTDAADDTAAEDDADDAAPEDEPDPEAESDAILSGPPPVLPPPESQPSGRAEEMWHNQTLDRCMTMSTKPFATFNGMAGRVTDFIKI